LKRYEGELKALKLQREQEKQNFFGGIAFMNKHAENAQKVM
jgi:pterin-4a-carbinolamine dehydratase